MTTLRRLFPLVVIAAMVASISVVSATASATSPAGASKKGKAKGKKCPKGKKLVTVTRNGKKVKVCKKKKPHIVCRASASCTPPPPPTNHLFDPPGQKLEGEAAKPFLQKYLLNSTFTDCVTGWPSCGGFEDRYSHWADNSFYMCLLKPTSGSDVKSVGEYGVTNARIESDGSWIFQEVVGWYGYQSAFEWRVSTTGVVEGAYQSTAGSGTPEKIGPLQYVGGTAKDCSY
jgi:hypothetical protein